MVGGRAGGALAALITGTPAAADPPRFVASKFIVPGQPLLLTRVLRRGLADGNEVVSTRDYRIRIVRDGNGWRVDGELIEARVTAPPRLAALAQAEQARPDSNMFPILLDAGGEVIPISAGAAESITAESSQSAQAILGQLPLARASGSRRRGSSARFCKPPPTRCAAGRKIFSRRIRGILSRPKAMPAQRRAGRGDRYLHGQHPAGQHADAQF